MTIGVYAVRSVGRGIAYVGSSINIESRFSNHRALLKRKSHYNEHLQNAWTEDGPSTFSFECLEEIKHAYDLIGSEAEWMDRLRERGDTIVNLSRPTQLASGPTVPITTQEVAERLGISAAHVRKLAAKHGLGSQIGARLLVFDDRDVRIISALLIPGRGRKKTPLGVEPRELTPEDDK